MKSLLSEKMKIQMLLFALCSPPKEATANLHYINNFPKSGKEGKKEEKKTLFSTCPSGSACYKTASWRSATSSPGAWRSLGTCVGKRRKPHRVDPLHGHPLQLGSKRPQKSCFFCFFFWSEGQIVPPLGPTLGGEGVLPPLTSGPCGASSRKGRGRSRPVGLDPG